jgi:hypothetical protein
VTRLIVAGALVTLVALILEIRARLDARSRAAVKARHPAVHTRAWWAGVRLTGPMPAHEDCWLDESEQQRFKALAQSYDHPAPKENR